VWRGPFADYRCLCANFEGCEAYDFVCFAAVSGILLGRSVYFPYGEELYPNFYVVLYGETNKTRKTTATRRARKLALDADPDLDFLPSVSSAEGLLKRLGGPADNPPPAKRLMLTLEEISALLQKARQEATASITTVITELYDCPPKLEIPTKTNPIVAQEPTVCILGATTPEWLERSLRESDIMGGFANRWVYVGGKFKPPRSRPGVADKGLWASLVEQLSHLRQRWAGEGQSTGFTLSAEAAVMWDKWYYEYWHPRQWGSQTLGAVVQRIPQHILKLAVIFAAWEETTTISAEALGAAIDFGTYAEDSVRELFEDIVPCEDGRVEKKILDFLASGPRLVSDVQKMLSGRVAAARLKSMISGLEKMERLKWVDPPPGRKGGWLALTDEEG